MKKTCRDASRKEKINIFQLHSSQRLQFIIHLSKKLKFKLQLKLQLINKKIEKINIFQLHSSQGLKFKL